MTKHFQQTERKKPNVIGELDHQNTRYKEESQPRTGFTHKHQ